MDSPTSLGASPEGSVDLTRAEFSVADISSVRKLSIKMSRLDLPQGLSADHNGGVRKGSSLSNQSQGGSPGPLRTQPSTARARRAVPFIIGVAGGTASGKTVGPSRPPSLVRSGPPSPHARPSTPACMHVTYPCDNPM